MKRGDVLMLHARRRPRLAQEALVRVLAARDLRPDHLDHPHVAEQYVLGLVDIAHAAGAEAIDEAVFPVNRLVGVGASEVGHLLATKRAG